MPEPGRLHPEGAWPLDRRDVVALGLVTFVMVLPLWGLMQYQGPPMEEGFMLVFPEEILRGAVPHRDFLHLYGPGSIYMLAAVYELFGTHIYVERLVGFVQLSAVAYATWFLLRAFGRRIATAGAVVGSLILLMPLGYAAMAWNGALALGLSALATAAAASRRPDGTARTVLLATAGALGGLALLFRPDMVIAVGLGLGAWWFQLGRDRRAPLLWGFLGALSLYIPHLLRSGVAESFRGMVLEPVFELRGGRTLPIPPSWDSIDGFLQRAGALRTSGWPLPMPELSQQIHLWFWLVPLSILLVLFTGWKLRRTERGSRRASTFWPAALFGAALVQQALQRPDTTHLAWVTGVTFPLAIAALAYLVELYRPAWPVPARQAIGVGVVALVMVAVIPFYPLRTYVDMAGQTFGINRFGTPIRNDGRMFPYGSPEAAADAQAVVDELDRIARPGDSLITGPTDLSRTNYNDSFFYHLFPDLEVGTRYIEMDPGLADAPGSGLAEEVDRADWLILSRSADAWSEPNESAESRSQEANRVVQREFCEVLDTPTFLLMGRCDRVGPDAT
ncbi:MAG: hypothetical protein R2716_10810 [Microthrixaceae bacterium]